MAAVGLVVGVAVVLATALDIGLTVLHPTVQGPLTAQINRTIWQIVRAGARVTRNRQALRLAGPLATAAMLLSWLAGFWVGFGLVYLPFIARFSTSVHFHHGGLFAALYVSASNLTTLGLGDLLPGQNGMRAAVVCEAGLGVATVSAAISYILSVYPLATQNRAHAMRFSDLHLQSVSAAHEFIEATGVGGLSALHQQLIDSHQSLRRFPVLYYFHPGDEAESVARLLECATILCIVARWAPPSELPSYGSTVARGLQATLTRIRVDYERRYIGGRSGRLGRNDQRSGWVTDRGDPAAEEVLHRLRDELGAREASATGDTSEGEEFAGFVTAMEAFLAGLGRSELHHHRSLWEQLNLLAERRATGIPQRL